MASTTPNIGLTLPTGAEKVSRQVINANNTIIDGKMGAVPVGQNLQGEIDALNSKIAIYEVTDWHNFKPDGSPARKYGYSASGSVLNQPLSGNNTYFGWVEGWNTYYVVHLIVHFANDTTMINSEWNCYWQNGTWTDWVRVSAYPSAKYMLTQNQTCSFTLTNYSAVKITVVGYDDNSTGEIIVRRDSSTLRTVAIKSCSTLGVSMNSNGVVTVTCNYQYGFFVKLEQLVGTVDF